MPKAMHSRLAAASKNGGGAEGEAEPGMLDAGVITALWADPPVGLHATKEVGDR